MSKQDKKPPSDGVGGISATSAMDALLLSFGAFSFLAKLTGLSLLFVILATVDFAAEWVRALAAWLKGEAWRSLTALFPWGSTRIANGHHA